MYLFLTRYRTTSSYPEKPSFLFWVTPLHVLKPLDGRLQICASVRTVDAIVEDGAFVVLVPLDSAAILTVVEHLFLIRGEELVTTKTSESFGRIFFTQVVPEGR